MRHECGEATIIEESRTPVPTLMHRERPFTTRQVRHSQVRLIATEELCLVAPLPVLSLSTEYHLGA